MFSRLASLSLLALPILAAATPAPVARTEPVLNCCKSTIPADSESATKILGLLGIVLQDLNVLIGLDCSPITVIGVGSGDTCSYTPVNCESNSGAIGIGCVPVSL